MIFHETPLAGAFLIELELARDERGFFARSFCSDEFAGRGLVTRWVQSNVSFNAARGTLRGMHWQAASHAETKLVRCTAGALYDVIVDPAHRGRGLMRHLFDAVLADPRIRGVLHLELYCRREHAPLYARWGFAPLAEDLVTMRRTAASAGEP